MIINYYDFYYTVIKKRDEKQIVDNQYEFGYTNFSDFITPNQKLRETKLK